MLPKDFKKFKALMKELPKAWLEWEEYFSNMDVNIPNHDEKADFYVSYLRRCRTVYDVDFLIIDMERYWNQLDKAFSDIINTMETHVKDYRKKNGIVVNDSDNKNEVEVDYSHDFDDDDLAKDDAEDAKADRDSFEKLVKASEAGRRRHEARIAKYHKEKQEKDFAKELAKPDVPEARKDEAELDKNFFGKVAKTFAKARKDSWKNSTSFDNMEKELGMFNELLKESSDLPEAERDKKLYDALDALDKKADLYLEHKVKRGINENAVAKVEATASMKEYIKERKAEIYSRQLVRDMKAELPDRSKGEEYSPYEIKGAEAKVSSNHFTALFDKLNISSEKKKEMQKIFSNAEAMMYIASTDFEPNKEVPTTVKEYASSFLTAELMRNELLVGGGEITPMMKQFIEGPEAFRKTMEATNIVLDKLMDNTEKNKFNEKVVEEFASRSTKGNIVYSYAKSNQHSILRNKDLFDSQLAYSATKIQDEKEAIERQNVEKAAKEKVKLEELKKQESAKEVSKKQKENLYLSRSYAYLAKYAKERNLSGPDWDGKADEYLKLSKEFQEKAMFGENAIEKKTGKASKSEKSNEKTI